MTPGDQPPGGWAIATWAIGALFAVLHWIGLSQIKRIGVLEEKKVDKADVRELIQEIREDRDRADEREAKADATRSLLYEKINAVALAVARLEGSDDKPPRRRR